MSEDRKIIPPNPHISPEEGMALDLLGILAESLSDMEKVRIATGNRIFALTDDGEHGKFRFPEHHPAVVQQIAMKAKLEEAEKGTAKLLRFQLRQVPWLAAFQKQQVGLGEQQVSRLVGPMGHPNWRYDKGVEEWVPRTIAQLWSLSGYSVIEGGAPRRKKGEQGHWNPTAKMRAFLIAESCIKQSESPYRAVYDAGRAKYADAEHSVECRRCGPSGKPAPVGSDLSDGHKHARAMRLTAKAILRDLWLAASDHPVSESHLNPVTAAAQDPERELVAA